ncbi:tbc1 domain family member 20/gtpase [Holotrichia oblita]|uniref:Tbc1 domain family member 20/gtpase n=1 Tax=Holotrichia oblita TaxID=644536 RepID=A0ACB9TI99_HOLOL|nr:tbc1 domain family member 20/gtpase [Holotrichia oblita]
MEPSLNSNGTEAEEEPFLLNNESDRISSASDDHLQNNDVIEDEDTRSELKFDEGSESPEEKIKLELIKDALSRGDSTLQTWRRLAIDRYGLVNDLQRKRIWPLLLDVDPDFDEQVPSLEELSDHKEYNQVVLDVNRSLKRFPPGIPYKQRLALQDQLTVLIMRVIMKYPHLRYYQGYHDVAITFLLVVGEVAAFRIMEVLSTEHLRECMEPTMEKTSYRLNYIYAVIQKVDKPLHDHMDTIDQRKKEERLRNRHNRNNRDNWRIRLHNYIPHWLFLQYRNKYGLLFATATVLFGIYAYLKINEKDCGLFKGPWNS